MRPADSELFQAAKDLGSKLIDYVSRSIAEQVASADAWNAETHRHLREDLNRFKEDVLCGMLSLIERVPETESFGIPEIPSEEVLRLVGGFTRQVTRADGPDPRDLFEAARYLVQVRRTQRANDLLGRILRGELGPDISGLGGGGYFLYLRSFEAASRLPTKRLEPWGDVDFEEILASKLDQGPWPLVALGRPDIQSFGAGKIESDDETWQEVLTTLGRNANAIVAVPCATEGTSWEIEWVVTKKFLRKTAFVMPPASPEQLSWWEGVWTALQRRSEYLGIAFPDYSPEGLFFSLGPGGSVSSRAYDTVLSSAELWKELLGGVLFGSPSVEWFTGFRETANAMRRKDEAERRGVNEVVLIQEKVDDHIERLTERMNQARPGSADEIGPEGLCLLERGDLFCGSFADWPPKQATYLRTPGVYTVWEGPSLIWVGTAPELFARLESHAEGRIEDDGFCETLFRDVVLAGLSEQVRRDVEEGRSAKDRLVRFHVRRDLSYRFAETEDLDEASTFEDLVRRGVLDAGHPKLNPLK